jgi:hypothetical protein
MTASATPERGGPQPSAAERPAGLKSSRRGDLEALAFLIGMFGTILVVVVTIGSTLPFGP